MTNQEFETQLSRLITAFGPRAVTAEKTKLLWRRFGFVLPDQFERVVDGVILNCRSIPTGEDFEREYSASTSQRYGNVKACEPCQGSGWSEVWETQSGSVVAERCACMGGPEALARYIESDAGGGDKPLASRILWTFSAEGRATMRKLSKAEITKRSLEQRQRMPEPFQQMQFI